MRGRKQYLSVARTQNGRGIRSYITDLDLRPCGSGLRGNKQNLVVARAAKNGLGVAMLDLDLIIAAAAANYDDRALHAGIDRDVAIALARSAINDDRSERRFPAARASRQPWRPSGRCPGATCR